MLHIHSAGPVGPAGGKELFFYCFFAFIASSLVMSSFLINIFVIFEFAFELFLLLIYGCDIGFETLLAVNSSDGFVSTCAQALRLNIFTSSNIGMKVSPRFQCLPPKCIY